MKIIRIARFNDSVTKGGYDGEIGINEDKPEFGVYDAQKEFLVKVPIPKEAQDVLMRNYPQVHWSEKAAIRPFRKCGTCQGMGRVAIDEPGKGYTTKTCPSCKGTGKEYLDKE